MVFQKKTLPLIVISDNFPYLTDEPLHLPVQPGEPPLDELRQEGDGVRGRLAAQRADRRKGVLNIYTK